MTDAKREGTEHSLVCKGGESPDCWSLNDLMRGIRLHIRQFPQVCKNESFRDDVADLLESINCEASLQGVLPAPAAPTPKCGTCCQHCDRLDRGCIDENCTCHKMDEALRVLDRLLPKPARSSIGQEPRTSNPRDPGSNPGGQSNNGGSIDAGITGSPESVGRSAEHSVKSEQAPSNAPTPKETRAEEIGGDIERRLGPFDPEKAEVLDEIVHDIAEAKHPPAAPEAPEEVVLHKMDHWPDNDWDVCRVSKVCTFQQHATFRRLP